MKPSTWDTVFAVLLGVILVVCVGFVSMIWMDPCIGFILLIAIAAAYSASFLLTEARAASPGEVTGRLPLQFALRDILLAFLVTAGAMGTAGSLGIVLTVYMLILIVVFRIARATQATLAKLGLMGLILFGLCGLCVLPSLPTPRIQSRLARCPNNLKCIDLALQNYLSEHHTLPEAHAVEEEGTPMHSWRVAILPYLDRSDMYEAYNYDESWNGPNNSQLSRDMPNWLQCPADPAGGPPFTNYVAITGPGTAWPEGRGSVPDDFRDGMSNTLLLAEVHGSAIHWMEPRDLTLDDLARGVQPKSGLGVSSEHSGGVNVAFADGSVRFLSNRASPELLRGLATVDGGEPIGATTLDDLPPGRGQPVRRQPGDIARFCSLLLMLISAVVLAFRPLRKDDSKIEPESQPGETDV